MRKYLSLIFLLVLLLSCSKAKLYFTEPKTHDEDPVLEHGEIVLGEQLEDPYSVKNMTRAFNKLYPTRSSEKIVKANKLYVRFLPQSDKQLKELVKMGCLLVDHPIDYRIIKEGDYYHDPSIERNKITWQYASVPVDFEFPKNIKYQILDECYLPDANTTRSDGIDWEEVEKEAFRLTGNEELLPKENARGWFDGAKHPSGRITIVDEKYGDKPMGLAGVQVLCNVFIKFSSCYTDRDGYYQIPSKFYFRPRYNLVFSNSKGFNIGFNAIILKGSVCTLGKHPNTGVDLTITKDFDRSTFVRAAVNNAVYDYYNRTENEDLAIAPPPGDLRLWLFPNMNFAAAPMMHHGAILDNNLISQYLSKYVFLMKIFLPDLVIGFGDCQTYAEIYGRVNHELALASLYNRVGNDYWNRFVEYRIRSILFNGGKMGDGTAKYAGYAEVAEMWSYYIQNKLYRERYNEELTSNEDSYWFHPQIFEVLEQRGFNAGNIFACISRDTRDVNELKNTLKGIFKNQSEIIEQTFARYGK